ncbi:cytochrome o ubiquinol oxidase subunit III [Salinisphaera sp. Q1T1-3]|uniref:cytochrome o ubiquinol oxidase subunit III n=1 Tax=Salinisphaera sp. Q1T1-3 TaxID=2321229 RepID=UPI000E762ED2|nr:cytochrome o ubiquinol oxidase subunit III [Salinisphaera sp. Q1T1-3]RJS91669.1 cytochrome o ubiquinol oxidase subunit III [Salinisphaera sp. Q1T1-3]
MTSHAGTNTVHGASNPNTVVNFGFWVYLMSDVILFSMLFTMFVTVSSHYNGGPDGHELFKLRDVFFETMALLFSSITFGMAMLAMHAKKKGELLLWLLVTFIFGLLFVLLEVHEFLELVGEGAGPQTSAFLSAFFTLVGTHGTHVTFGLIWILAMVGQIAVKGVTPAVASRLFRLSLFWHFLDIVWIAVFSTVYLSGVMQ